MTTLAGDLRCNICDVLVTGGKKLSVESHRKSKHLEAGLQRKSRSQGKQIFLHLDQVNFKEKLVSLFQAAHIPLHKLNHPALKPLFATMEKVLSSTTATRTTVAQLASQKENQIRELLHEKNLFNCR